MPEAVSLAFAFGLPPEQAIEYFRKKGYAISWDWRGVWQEMQAKAFTVAKAMRVDILQDIRGAVDRAIAEGETFETFQKKLEPVLRAKGWWGRQMIVDSDGVAQMAQLGSPWRLRTIYDTNLQTAYMAGRYKALMENVSDRPYWMYVAVMDGRTRPAHAALNGKIFRSDDAFWRHFYPPNGFRCRCRVRALSAADMKSRGLSLSNSNKYLKEDTQVDRDGFIYPSAYLKLPGMATGVRPDQGWAYNPGRTQARWDPAGMLPDCGEGGLFFADEKSCLPPRARQPNWRILGRPDLRDVAQADRLAAPELLPRARSAAQAQALLEASLGLDDATPFRYVETPISRVLIAREWIPHWVEKFGDHREVYGNFVIPTLERPFEIYLSEYGDGRIRPRYIGLFTGKRNLMVVIRENGDGGLVWNIMQADDKDLNGHRWGQLLWPRG